MSQKQAAEPITLQALQAAIKAGDFNPDNPNGYFLKLVEEMGELSEALRKGRTGQPDAETLKGSVAEELYDVLYYVCALANIHGVDLALTHDVKSAINRRRYPNKK